MALRAWVTFVVGIIAVYAIMTLLGGSINFIFGIYNYVKETFNATGIQVDPVLDQSMQEVHDKTVLFWTYAPIIVFIAMIAYVIMESQRRRPEEYYY